MSPRYLNLNYTTGMVGFFTEIKKGSVDHTQQESCNKKKLLKTAYKNIYDIFFNFKKFDGRKVGSLGK